MSVSLDEIRVEVQGLGRDEGLTVSKLEGTQLLTLIRRPLEWSDEDAAVALQQLILELVARIRDEKPRVAARATLNLGTSPVAGRSGTARQKALAADRSVHPDTVREWWYDAVESLLDVLPRKIEELNSTPGGWSPYGPTFTLVPDEDRPNFSLDRVDVAWRLRGRVGEELLSYRWLRALEDGVDRYQAIAWYFSDPDHDKYEVVPLLNCEKGQSTRSRRGILLTDLVFPEPLSQSDSIFFAYKVLIKSDREAETVFLHSVRSAGVSHLIFRVQFDPCEMPTRAWSFTAMSDADPYVLPPDGSPRYLVPNRLGYVEEHFRNCKRGAKYGISWQWP